MCSHKKKKDGRHLLADRIKRASTPLLPAVQRFENELNVSYGKVLIAGKVVIFGWGRDSSVGIAMGHDLDAGI
jgi:hypothetical protein